MHPRAHLYRPGISHTHIRLRCPCSHSSVPWGVRARRCARGCRQDSTARSEGKGHLAWSLGGVLRTKLAGDAEQMAADAARWRLPSLFAKRNPQYDSRDQARLPPRPPRPRLARAAHSCLPAGPARMIAGMQACMPCVGHGGRSRGGAPRLGVAGWCWSCSASWVKTPKETMIL